MNIFCEASPKTGVYRTVDDVKNFKIRLNLKKVRSAGLHSRSIDPVTNVEEVYTFQWQEKVFSKTELEFYSKETNCITDLDKKYHNDIKNNQNTDSLFSYVEEDEFCLIEENVTTEIKSKMTNLHKEMMNLRLKDVSENKEKSDDDFDMKMSLDKCLKEAFYRNKYQNMYIMADLGMSDIETNIWLKSEHILCNFKYDSLNQILYVYPDFSKNDECPYTLETGGDGKEIYEYYIKNVSKEKTKEFEEKENLVIQKILKRNQEEKNQIVGLEFIMPQRNMLKVHLFFEILTAKDFEYDNIYVQYNIDLPEFWKCDDDQLLYGSTQTCETKGFQKIANWGHNFYVSLDYNMKDFDKKGIPRPPYIYFQVVSRDYWDRYRCEGIAYKAIPVFQTGIQHFELQCIRVCPKSPIGDLRRYFIGDYGSIDDISWTGLPKDYESDTLNKFGIKTIGTGTIEIRLNVLNQSKRSTQLDSQSNDRLSAIEGMGASSLVKSVEEVVNAFKKAQERMQKARKLVLERKQLNENHE